MWLQLAVSEADLSTLFERLLPLRIDLAGEGRFLELRPPAQLTMLKDVGAQLSCGALLTYAVVGLQPEFTIETLRLDVSLALEGERCDVLVLGLRLDAADTRGIPAFVDRAIAEAVNARLAGMRLPLAIGELLTHRFTLPDSALAVRTVATSVDGGQLRITEDGVTLVVTFDVAFAP